MKGAPIYGVATISRLPKIIGLFCKRAPQKSLYSAKETCNFTEPTHRSHPMTLFVGLTPHQVYERGTYETNVLLKCTM